MSSIDEITGRLLSIVPDVSMCVAHLQRECEEITNSMNKAQREFGDQEAGQQLVAMLYGILQNISFADSSLYSLQKGIKESVQNLQK